MANDLFLSIITINYNNAAGLRKTLESARNQTSKNYEHIIIDGGSTDDSVSIIKEFLADSEYAKQVSFWCSEKDKGIYDAMNKGIPHANGKYCLFLNSGDYLADVDVVNRFSKYKYSDNEIIYTNAIFYDNKKKWLVNFPDKITLNFFYAHKSLCHQNMLFPVSYMKNNLYSLEYKITADVDLYIKAYRVSKLRLRQINDVISCYECELGMSSTVNKDILNAEWDIMINKYIPRDFFETLDETKQITAELNIYENYYHGILKSLLSLLKKYTKLKEHVFHKSH